MADRQRPIATTAKALGMFGFFMLAAMMVPRALGASAKKPATARSYFVYVGTYTRESSKGIYGYRFDPRTGKFTSTGLAAESKAALHFSRLRPHPSLPVRCFGNRQ